MLIASESKGQQHLTHQSMPRSRPRVRIPSGPVASSNRKCPRASRTVYNSVEREVHEKKSIKGSKRFKFKDLVGAAVAFKLRRDGQEEVEACQLKGV